MSEKCCCALPPVNPVGLCWTCGKPREVIPSNLRVAAQAVLDHAQPANYAADWVMVHRTTMGRLREALSSPDETPAPHRDLSASERLHNICDALSEQADESPFSREEWECVDAQTVAVGNAARALLDKMEQVYEHPQYKAAWELYMLRGAPYRGPTWGPEFDALRALVGRVNSLPEKTAVARCPCGDRDCKEPPAQESES